MLIYGEGRHYMHMVLLRRDLISMSILIGVGFSLFLHVASLYFITFLWALYLSLALIFIQFLRRIIFSLIGTYCQTIFLSLSIIIGISLGPVEWV